jgi:hypothetical protein
MGRPKGAIGNRSKTLLTLALEKNYNPALRLMKTALTDPDPDRAHDADKALMPYFYPKLSNIEFKGVVDVAAIVGIEPEAVKTIETILSRKK